MQAMIEEYQSIINNYVLDVVPRPKDKSIVSSKWIFKTRIQQMAVLKSSKQDLLNKDFDKRKELIMKKLLHH